jgi:hypothetical protein
MLQGPAMIRGVARQHSHQKYLEARYEARLMGRNTTVEAKRQKAKYAHRDCPECGHAMKIRTARKGRNAGSRFLGCSLYPSCKAPRAID